MLFVRFLLYNTNMENNYVKNPLPKMVSVKSIYTIHYFKYGKNFQFPTESHNFWELVYVDGGNATIIAGENELQLKQGEAVLHAPGILHTIKTEDSFANSAIISFECTSRQIKVLKDKILSFNEKEKAILREILNEGSKTYAEKLNDLHLCKMTKRINAPVGSEQIIKNDIELLLISLIRKEEDGARAETPATADKTDIIAERITAILKEKVYETITLDEISHQLYFSKTYIKNVFRKHTGTSVIQYFINLKIEEAKKLISQNKYSFTEISDRLGFNSVHYFSRLFKQRTDMSPSEYAKSLKVDNLIH